MGETVSEWLTTNGLCFGPVDEGLGALTPAEGWDACNRSDWLVAALGALGTANSDELRGFACEAVESCISSAPDTRSASCAMMVWAVIDGALESKDLDTSILDAQSAARASWADGDNAGAAAADAALFCVLHAKCDGLDFFASCLEKVAIARARNPKTVDTIESVRFELARSLKAIISNPFK